MTDISFIAGGSKGLGAALLNALQAKNHQVFEFSRSGQNAQHINSDFNLPNEAKKVFNNCFDRHAKSQYHSINLVINTAVLAPFGALDSANEVDISSHLNINIETTLFLLQAFLAKFENHKGKKTITYVSSGAARRAIPGLALYSASKAFFERLMDTLAEEQKSSPHPFDCMVVNPGVMNTSMQAEIRSQNAKNFPMVEIWSDLHLKGQLADPAAVAEVCSQLITETGINGGYYTAQHLQESEKN